MATPYWTNRLSTMEDTAAIQELVYLVYGNRHSELLDDTFWRWRYLNDAGFRGQFLIAEYEERPIGALSFAMFEFQWGEQRLTGAMHSGLITHPDHRRRGIFRSLTTSVTKHAAREGAVFLRSTPNDSSLSGFLKFGDWAYPGPIPVYLKFLSVPNMIRPKSGRILAKVGGWPAQLVLGRRRPSIDAPRCECELAEVVPDELDAVFEEFAHDCNALMTRRTAAYWNWRYAAKPDPTFRTILARQAGRLMGAVATAVQQHNGMEVGLVLDVVARNGIPTFRQLLRAAEDDFRSRNIGLVACQATSRLFRGSLSEESYLSPKPQWLPKKFHYIYHVIASKRLPRELAKFEDWHITFGDSDNT